MRATILEQIADYLCAHIHQHPLRVAIDGVDAAGKTTLADEIVTPLRQRGRSVIRASLDSFQQSCAHRYARGTLSPKGYYEDAFDIAAVRSMLLAPLGPGGDCRYQTAAFDVRTDMLAPSPIFQAQIDSILLFDGVFLLRPELNNGWDVKIFVDVTFEVALARALQRELAAFGSEQALRERYQRRYIPGQQLYLRACRPRECADLIVMNDDLDQPTLLIQRPGAPSKPHDVQP